MIALAYGLHYYSGVWLATSWQEQLETVAEEQVPTLVERLAQIERNGLPVLVRALNSSRACVARAAKRGLWQEIDQWEKMRNRDASRKAACLAQTLADEVDGFGPQGQDYAADVAARILNWPGADEVVRAKAVMAACEHVIRTSRQPRPLWAARPSPASDSPPDTGQDVVLESARRSPAETDAQDGTIKQLTYVPGGGLPIVPSVEALTEDRATSDSASKPSQGPVEDVKKSPSPVPEAAKSLEPSAASEPAPIELPAGQPLRRASQTAQPLASREPAPPASREGQVTKKLLLADPLELMRQLRSQDSGAAETARQELQRRGFTEVHLELAKQMFDPDPEVRKQLARMLPELRSVNSTPWLVWLCRDRDADVRLLAVTMLATSNDPTVLAQVERLARLDEDPRIQDQAQRMARCREGRPGAGRR